MPSESKTSGRRVRNKGAVIKALELRKAGASFQEIGDTIGLSRQRAYQLVSAGLAELDETCTVLAAETRRLMLDRIDSAILKLWPQRGNPRVSDSLVRLYDRQARLLGLDAPQKVAETDAAGNDVSAEQRAAIRAKLLQ